MSQSARGKHEDHTFDSEHGRVQNEVAAFVKDDVGRRHQPGLARLLQICNHARRSELAEPGADKDGRTALDGHAATEINAVQLVDLIVRLRTHPNQPATRPLMADFNAFESKPFAHRCRLPAHRPAT